MDGIGLYSFIIILLLDAGYKGSLEKFFMGL